MTQYITPDQIDLFSSRVANQALAGGWRRTIPWPTDVLGAYGSGATDEAVDAYVADACGVPPGGLVDLGAGNPPGVLSACPGRDAQLRPVIVLSLRMAPGAPRPAHRPRQDPTAARVVKSYRLHPDTALKIEIEARRTGESQGQVIDRLAKSLPN